MLPWHRNQPKLAKSGSRFALAFHNRWKDQNANGCTDTADDPSTSQISERWSSNARVYKVEFVYLSMLSLSMAKNSTHAAHEGWANAGDGMQQVSAKAGHGCQQVRRLRLGGFW